jgi:alpha-amylase/alpha-mannosidase (GH57 family)
MERSLCIHGHFYQPPRENPWLEAVEVQDSAYPYHDWNERITAECYATNAASRVLDEKTRIVDIVSNYANISFDMGPTLLSWLEKNSPEVYESVLEADRQSIERCSGHGAAMAQCYNHMIMPLANSLDKRTQAIWGIRDFRHRFRRMPEGMWLPETAVDLETLDILAGMGVRFTLLAPHQAKRIRPIGGEKWTDVPDAKVDPTRAYLLNLPSGRSINLFFYDSPVSHAVAFERILDSGEEFALRLLKGFSDRRDWPQIMHICTDGESYGHHHRFGDMALAYALDHIEGNNLAKATNYGEYLEKNPPRHEVEVFENTSWSCAHGVERWRSDCGCSTGINPRWNQQWRAPLREALDWLREELSEGYDEKAREFLKDPWAARDDYIDVILDRSEENIMKFFEKHSSKPLGRSERVRALCLLELQRHAMLMYTSCGWFFDDISGIETVQIIQYAGRALQLAKSRLEKSLESDFTERLRGARSNIPRHGDGALIYERSVKPSRVSLKKVAAHYAISSLFNEYPEETDIYSYRVKSLDYRKSGAGKPELVTGRCGISSRITGASETVCFSVLHLGNHDFNCGVRRSGGEESCKSIIDEINSAFESGAFSDVVRLIDKYFSTYRYSLKDLFREEQRKILETLLAETTEDFEASYRRMYETNRILMGFLRDTGIPAPKAFTTAAEFTLNLDLKRSLKEEADIEKTREMLDELENWGLSLDTVDLEFTSRRRLEQEMKTLLENPMDIELLARIETLIDIALTMPFKENLWTMQNIYYRMAKTAYPEIMEKIRNG